MTPYPDPSIINTVAQKQQHIQQLYVENLMYSGTYYQGGGSEDIDSYLERGLYYHYKFSGENMDERIYISQQFSSPFTENPQVMIFDHFLRTCKFEMKNGEVYRVYVSPVN